MAKSDFKRIEKFSGTSLQNQICLAARPPIPHYQLNCLLGLRVWTDLLLNVWVDSEESLVVQLPDASAAADWLFLLHLLNLWGVATNLTGLSKGTVDFAHVKRPTSSISDQGIRNFNSNRLFEYVYKKFTRFTIPVGKSDTTEHAHRWAVQRRKTQ